MHVCVRVHEQSTNPRCYAKSPTAQDVFMCVCVCYISFISKPSPPPAFDRLQYTSDQKLEVGKAWEQGYDTYQEHVKTGILSKSV